MNRSDVRSPLRPPYLAPTLGIVSLVTLIAFEALAISTAMPVVAADLGAVRSYGLAFVSFLASAMVGTVLSGAWCDARGPRLPTTAGLVLFAAGMVVSGLAGDFDVLLVGRVVAGLGGGMAIVSVYVVIARLYPETLRPALFGLMSAAWVLPGLLGPPIAGFLAENVSWRAVFLLVPFFVLPPALVLLPKVTRLGAPDLAAPFPWARLAAGVGLAAATALLQWGLGTLRTPGGVVAAVAGVVLLVLAAPRVLPRGAFRLVRGLPTVVLLRGMYAGAFFSVDAFVPLMLVRQRGLSPTVAGLVIGAASIGWTVGSWLQGRPRFGRSRHRLLQLGGLVLGLGLVSMTLMIRPPLPALTGIAFWSVAALGMGLAATSTSVLTLSLSPKAEQGANSSALQLSDMLGSTLGIGLAGAAFATWHDPDGSDAALFTGIWVAAGALGLASAVVALRAKPG